MVYNSLCVFLKMRRFSKVFQSLANHYFSIMITITRQIHWYKKLCYSMCGCGDMNCQLQLLED